MASHKRQRSPPREGYNAYTKSKTIEDRASSFIAVYSPTISARQLQAFPEFRSASHRIAAWRTPSKQTTLAVGSSKPKGIYDVGHDDDDEQWAGKRLEKVLEETNMTGNIVVARWYGGVLLGPARFRWIEETAREAIQRWRKGERGDAPGTGVESDPKRQKVDAPEQPAQPAKPATPAALAQEYRNKEELIEELKQRDESIAVLRKFLAEKRAKLDKSLDEPSKAAAQPSPSKVPNYSSLPIDRLKMLDKGRDATLSHLLKELDKIDQQLAEEAELDAAFAVIAEKEERKEAKQNEEEAWNEMERIMAEEEAAKASKADDAGKT